MILFYVHGWFACICTCARTTFTLLHGEESFRPSCGYQKLNPDSELSLRVQMKFFFFLNKCSKNKHKIFI